MYVFVNAHAEAVGYNSMILHCRVTTSEEYFGITKRASVIPSLGSRESQSVCPCLSLPGPFGVLAAVLCGTADGVGTRLHGICAAGSSGGGASSAIGGSSDATFKSGHNHLMQLFSVARKLTIRSLLRMLALGGTKRYLSLAVP